MIKSLLVLACALLVAQCQLDGMEFLIYSRRHYLRHLVISGARLYFNKNKLYPDAFFKFKESRSNPGYYTLESSEHKNHFLAVSPGNPPTVYYKENGRPDDTSLFEFISVKNTYPKMAVKCPGCYYIRAKNCGGKRKCCLRVSANDEETLRAHTNCDFGSRLNLGVFELKARFNPRIKTVVTDDVDLRNVDKSAKGQTQTITY